MSGELAESGNCAATAAKFAAAILLGPSRAALHQTVHEMLAQCRYFFTQPVTPEYIQCSNIIRNSPHQSLTRIMILLYIYR